MSETLSEFNKRMEDKEGWLAALLEKDQDEVPACDPAALYATAGLVRGALNAVEAPESALAEAQKRALARMAELQWERRQEQDPLHPWLSRLGSWLQVAFNLFRRR
jgi:hypothetical protein